jgi:hypothetical protein
MDGESPQQACIAYTSSSRANNASLLALSGITILYKHFPFSIKRFIGFTSF